MSRRVAPVRPAGSSTSAISGTILNAKGDLISASAADTPAILTAGTNNQILVADSGQTTGLKWATPTGVGGHTSRILCRPTAATATAGNLVSTTAEADTNASASISFSASIAGYKSGFVFTSTGATGTNKYSAWKLNMTVPDRFVIEADMGNRTANIQPMIFFLYGSITHLLTPYRTATNGSTIGVTGRNNSTSAVNYTTGTPVVGLANDYGGKIRIECDFSAMSAGPLGTYTITTFGSSEFNTMRNSVVGHFTTVDASWAALTKYIAIGCSEITTTGDTTNISNLVVMKHPLDE